MWRLIGTLMAMTLVLGAGARAEAQTGERIIDTLGDLLRGGGGQQVQGHVVAVSGSELVLRGRDNRTYTISTAEVDPPQLARLHPGQAVKVTLKRGNGPTPVAASISGESGEQRAYRTASGAVEAVSGDRVQFRTTEGFVIPIDLAQIVGRKPALRVGDTATVTYEVAGQNPLTAVWIEPRDTMGAASPRTTDPQPATGGYQRIHGFVESIGIGTFTLKSDDGRTMTVDVRNSRGSAGDVRPGDLVNVVGRAGDANTFVAEVVQKD
jgi:hypothetical protein